MSPFTTLAELLGRNGSKIGTKELKLPDATVEHDSIDQMEFYNFADDSPRFRRMTIEEPPVIEPHVAEPDPIDFTSATPDEIKEWQAAAKAARAAREDAPPYSQWDKLTRDVFYSYHTHDMPGVLDEVDPGVELHKRIMPKMMTTDEHAQARNVTRDNPTMAAMATMAAVNVLKDVLGEELAEQARESEEYNRQAENARQACEELDDLRDQAKDHRDKGQPVPQPLIDAIKQAVKDKRAAQSAAAQAAEQVTPMDASALAAIESAAQAGKQAADAAANLPSFGQGFGQGEPVYESPEQALAIAEMWANNPDLRAMAELFGRLDRDIRFQRAKRVVGGQDEIVDVEFGDNLNRVLPSELALLADEDTEDDFLVRFASRELLCFSTVGEELAGRGPIVLVVDGSGTMAGERNIWARAISMCLLNIARREKRDFAMVEFSGGRQTEQWLFPAKAALDAEQIVEMASHFFGGGTVPINGVASAAKIMEDSAEFKKADLVIIGDGEAGYGPEDERLRSQLDQKGVRIFGIAIGTGSTYRYLESYCEHVVHVSDFELTDPSAATAELATHIT
jgi:uncharacterized protein with von Willebrand factor type A (vWA) domain